MKFSEYLEEYLKTRDAINWRLTRGYPSDELLYSELERYAEALDAEVQRRPTQ